MIEVKNLSKYYGSHQAVKNVSFEVNDNEILGFLGPNGAGKSTTMNILTGYISSTQGDVLIDGYDILLQPELAKKRIGYLPEQPPLYPDMTVKEYLKFVYNLKKVAFPAEAHIMEICRLVKIETHMKRLIKNLSKGYKQRVGIAQALIGNPKVLVLDEPTDGLDPKQNVEVREMIRKLGKKHTVIISSHRLSEVQSMCSRVIMINQGQIVANDTMDNLSGDILSQQKITVRAIGNSKEIELLLRGIPDVTRVSYMGIRENKTAHEFIVNADNSQAVRKIIFERMAQKRFTLVQLSTNTMSLEDIFLDLTSRDPEPEPVARKKSQKSANKVNDSTKQLKNKKGVKK